MTKLIAIACSLLVVQPIVHSLPDFSGFDYDDVSLRIEADNERLIHSRPVPLDPPDCFAFGYRERKNPAKIFLGVNFRFGRQLEVSSIPSLASLFSSNELRMLDIHLHELFDVVDVFIIV